MYHHKEGIWYRKIDRSDLKDLKELKDASWWGTHSTMIINDEDQERWYESLSSRGDLVMIAMKEDERAGVCCYTNQNNINRSCHISGSIFRDASKKSLAKAAWFCGLDFAFEILNMRRLEAEVLPYNLPAQNLNIDAIGMKVEGVRRQAVYKSGRYYDSIMLGLLRDEWEADERVLNYGGSCNTDIDHDKTDKLIKRSKYV